MDSPEGPGFVMYRGYTKQEALDSVGPGWSFLIEAFFDWVELNNMMLNKNTRIIQVKEKYGLLTIYASDGGEFEWGVVHGLALASGRICEYCGKGGELRVNLPWNKTLCDDCLNKESRRDTADRHE